MRAYTKYLLLLMFGLITLGSCTNDETDEGLETLTPNEPSENVAVHAHTPIVQKARD